MSHNRHSYVPFYPSDWIAGTAGMPRLMWSLYFQICLHNWDKNHPMSESYLRIMTSDLPPDQVSDMLQMMIDTGKIILDEELGFYNPRALEEADKAFKLWEKKSKGGKAGGSVSTGKFKHSQNSHEGLLKESSSSPQQNQNQNQNQIPPLPPSEGGEEDSKLDEDEQAVKEIADFQTQTEELKAGMAIAVESTAQAWNKMAAAHGFMQIGKMAPKRFNDMSERIAKYGLEEILNAIEAVPEYQRNTGKDGDQKPSIDWFLRDVRLNKIMGHDFTDVSDDVPPPAPKPPVLVVDGENEEIAAIRHKLLKVLGPAKYAWFVNDASFAAEDTANGPVLRISNKGMVKLYDAERVGLVNRIAKDHGFVGVWS